VENRCGVVVADDDDGVVAAAADDVARVVVAAAAAAVVGSQVVGMQVVLRLRSGLLQIRHFGTFFFSLCTWESEKTFVLLFSRRVAGFFFLSFFFCYLL